MTCLHALVMYVQEVFTAIVLINAVTVLLHPGWVEGIPQDEFYPFGEEAGDSNFRRYSSNQRITLNISPFPFFGVDYSVIYVNSMGTVSLTRSYSYYWPRPFDSAPPLIAPFWVYLNDYGSDHQNVWYRETNDSHLLQRVENAVSVCRDDTTFRPTSLFIATWDQVTPYQPYWTELSFQCVLATDEVKSFAIFLYGDELSMNQMGSGSYSDAQMGINSGYGVQFFSHPDSFTLQLYNISDGPSNTDTPGVWLFRVDGDGEISRECSTAFIVDLEDVTQPPGEGDGTGVAAILRLSYNSVVAFNDSDYVEVSVHLAVMTGGSETAIEGEDFMLDTREFNFTLNATELESNFSSGDDSTDPLYLVVTKDVIVTLIDDSLVEDTENYILSIANISDPFSIRTGTIRVNITDNEFATVDIEGTASPPGEGDSPGAAALLRLKFFPQTATLSENVIVDVRAYGRGEYPANIGVDLALNSTELIFSTTSSNDAAINILVTPLDDDVFVEVTKGYGLYISIRSGPASIEAENRITVNYPDNEVATVSIEEVESPPGEGDGDGSGSGDGSISGTATAYVRLSIEPTTALLGRTVAVNVTVKTGSSVTASEGADFTLVTKVVFFPVNSVNGASKGIVVTIVDDILVEGTESYMLSIEATSGPAAVTFNKDTVTVAIVDNDVSNENGVDFLDFIDVTAFDNMRELHREEDSYSDPIYIPRPGMLYGENVVSAAYVNENGVISFNTPWRYSYPQLFPTTNFRIRTEGLAVAPFWSDVDIRKSGVIRYATFSPTDSEASRNRTEYQDLERVNEYVNSNLPDIGDNSSFSGTWMLVAHWDNVYPSPHGADNRPQIKGLSRRNNFQGVIVTNVSHTFAIFNYICGELRWSGLGRDNLATVGYIASGNIFSNHPASGFSTVGRTISCSSLQTQFGQRNSLIQVIGIGNRNLLDKLDSCLKSQPFDDVFENAGKPNAINSFASMLEPCPPVENLVRMDIGRFRVFGSIDNPNCYITTKPLRVKEPEFSQFTITQHCCYIAGGLVTEGPMAGGTLLYHPILDETNYRVQDEEFRRRCCTLKSPDLCDIYFNRRPTNNGNGYQSPVVAWGSGDPHFRTLDGRNFDFQGSGEFYSLNTLGENGSAVFSLQGRQHALHFSSRVTFHTAVAFGQPGVIAYELGTPNFKVYQTVPTDSKRDITVELGYGELRYDEQAQSLLIRNGNALTAAFFESGVVLEAGVYGSHISWTIRVPRSFKGRTEGLLGLLDDSQRNDFKFRNGTDLPGPINDRNIYKYYVDTWRVDEADRMFFTQDRQKRQAVDDLEPVFVSDFNFTDEQIAVCEGNPQCLLDLVVTNDTEIAVQTLEEEREANATIDLLENLTPNISASGSFRVNLGEEAVYAIEVLDPGDNVTLTLQGGLPLNSLIEELSVGEFFFKWNLQELTNDPLLFVAIDTRNASSTHTPTVEICACANDGVCTLDGLLTSNTTITMACQCSEAFTGQFCEEDRNGCGEIQCYIGVECLDVPAPGVGAVCGACPLGFTGDGLKCYDIDECELNETQCEDLCVNTEGSFQCDCSEGYQLVDITQCEDVDECTENFHDCEQICENTVGSYNCSCEPGFTYNSDGRNCIADQPCNNGGGCSHTCALVDGVAQCFCPLGLQLPTLESLQCVDIDECPNSNCNQTCVNSFGSFKCACNDGYSLSNDGRNCDDIDECFEAALDGVDPCVDDSNTQCSNREGSFECVCIPGFARNNGTCQVIEEEPPPPPPIATPPNGLESSVNFFSPTLNISDFTPERQQRFREVTASAVVGLCMNTTCIVITTDGDREERYNLLIRPQNIAIPQGILNHLESGELNITFYVQLNDGSVLHVENLTTAVEDSLEEYRSARFLPDINECMTNNGGCEQVCINTHGSFRCDCNYGYTLNTNGSTCYDIDECSVSNGGCAHACTNTVGSFCCNCNDGFTLNVNGTTCDDTNECSMDSDSCDQLCTNTIGSYSCKCNDGFTLNANGATCDDVDECSTSNGGCDHLCTNTVGMFTCSCHEGFVLSSDGKTCDPKLEILPQIEEQAGLLITLSGYNTQNFTVEVQNDFKQTTAMVLNMYCRQECTAQPVSIRKRQSRLFTEDDVIITNIVDASHDSEVQFELYIIYLEGDISVLPKVTVMDAIQENTEVYESAGFISVSVQFLVFTSGLSTREIVGITFGSLSVVLLISGLGIGLCCLWYCHTKQSTSQAKKVPLDFINPNFKAEADHDVIQSVSITFKDDVVYESRSTTPVPEVKKEDISSL